MSCRCNDIADCEDDIDKLQEMIQYLDQAETEAETIENMLEKTAGETENAVVSVRIGECRTAMTKLDDRVIEIIREAKREAIDKLDYCERELPDMRSEDEEYHEEEDDEDD